jgi:hypothetical protein
MRRDYTASYVTIQRYAPGILILAVLLLAFILRFHQLGAQSLWHDEGNSYAQSIRSVGEIANHAARDIHPPGYYWLLGAWRLISGESEFALRALSAFAGVLTVALAYAIGKRLYNAWAGVLAALFVALNTFAIYYGQEARMYALLAMLVAAGMAALLALIACPTWTRALLLALINAAGLYTQYAYPLFMLVQGVLALLWIVKNYLSHHDASGRAGARPYKTEHNVGTRGSTSDVLIRYIVTNLIALVLFLPWLPTTLTQIGNWQQTGGEVMPASDALQVIVTLLVFGMTVQTIVLAIPIMLGLFSLLNTDSGLSGWWRGLFAPLWVTIPVALFLALELARPQNFKMLLPAQAGAALWIAGGIAALWRLPVRARSPRRQELLKWVSRAASVTAALWIVLTLINLLPPLYADPAFQRSDYRAIATTITTLAHAGDAIILDAPNQAEVFTYYYRGDLPVIGLPAGLGGDDAATLDAVEALITDYDRLFVVFWGEDERDPLRIVETTLDGLTFEGADQWFGDVRLARYFMPQPMAIREDSGAQFGDHITLENFALNSTVFQAGEALQAQLVWSTDAPLDQRYKVFVQLLDENGALAAQRDSEPGGGLALTTTWTPDQPVTDNHALILPDDLPSGDYTLIVGLYALETPNARLPATSGDFVILATISVE